MIRPIATSLIAAALVSAAAPSLLAQSSGAKLVVPPTIRSAVDRITDELYGKVVEIRRDIHRHPELGFREKRTAGLVAARLRELGFDRVREGVGVTGVVGDLVGGRPGPVVAVRADMDALPIPDLNDVPYKSTVDGVKHACGHDAHVAIALGVAELLSRMRAELPGTVRFIFQPAEEGDPDGGETGALRMLRDGALENPVPAAIFGLHVMATIDIGRIAYNSGASMASADRFTLTVIGKKTHGAYPHTGIDPVPIAAQIVMALQTIPSRLIDAQTPTVISVGAIHGGNRYNIIADKVELVGTVRSLEPDGSAFVREKMESIAKSITGMYGATYDLDYDEFTTVTWNDPALTAASLPALAAVVGEDALFSPPPQMGAEDFSYFQKKIPGFFYFVGVRNEKRGITSMQHTERYDIDEEALRIGMRTMSLLVLDFLERQQRATGAQPSSGEP